MFYSIVYGALPTMAAYALHVLIAALIEATSVVFNVPALMKHRHHYFGLCRNDKARELS